MSYELVFTSATSGLKPGSRGFCSVAFTEGMPANCVQFCENLSGYVHIYLTHDINYKNNPLVFSHLVSVVGGKRYSVLSRISAFIPDYTGRSNKLAHHLMLTSEEVSNLSQGPSALMNNDCKFFEEWKSHPVFLPNDRQLLTARPTTTFRADKWGVMLGDAGWAGVLAQSFLDTPTKPSFILFEPGMDLLPLIVEAQALLPAKKRWEVTFSTYYTTLPVGINCCWRCCLPNSEALKYARRTQGVLLIDLVNKRVEGPLPAEQKLVESARTGRQPSDEPEIALKREKITETTEPKQRQEALQTPKPPRYKPTPVQRARPVRAAKTQPKKMPIMAVVMIASVIIVLLAGIFGLWVSKRSKLDADKPVTAHAQRSESDLVVVLTDDDIPHGEHSEKREHLPMDFVPQDEQPGVNVSEQDDTTTTSVKSSDVDPQVDKTLDKAEQPVIPVFQIVDGNKIQYNPSWTPKLYGVSNIIEYKRIPVVVPGGSVRLEGNNIPLWEENKTINDKSVHLIEIKNDKESKLAVCQPLSYDQDSVTIGDHGEYTIKFSDTETTRKYLKYINNLKNEITARGEIVGEKPKTLFNIDVLKNSLILRAIDDGKWKTVKAQEKSKVDIIPNNSNEVMIKLSFVTNSINRSNVDQLKKLMKEDNLLSDKVKKEKDKKGVKVKELELKRSLVHGQMKEQLKGSVKLLFDCASHFGTTVDNFVAEIDNSILSWLRQINDSNPRTKINPVQEDYCSKIDQIEGDKLYDLADTYYKFAINIKKKLETESVVLQEKLDNLQSKASSLAPASITIQLEVFYEGIPIVRGSFKE